MKQIQSQASGCLPPVTEDGTASSHINTSLRAVGHSLGVQSAPEELTNSAVPSSGSLLVLRAGSVPPVCVPHSHYIVPVLVSP